jgi:hypothetical protein
MKIRVAFISLLYSISANSLVFTDEQVLDYAFVTVYSTTCEQFSSNGKRLFLRDINLAYGSLESALQDERFSNGFTVAVGIKLIAGDTEFCKAGIGALKDTGNYNRMFR